MIKTTPSHEKALGVLLVVVGGLILLVKLVPAVTIHAVLKLWPALLIWLGWRMTQRPSSEESTEKPTAES